MRSSSLPSLVVGSFLGLVYGGRYTVTDLGSLGDEALPAALNNKGEITGYSQLGPENPKNPFCAMHLSGSRRRLTDCPPG
jgi:hypothetical protein